MDDIFMLIGISGKKKSGKDTAGIQLSLKHNMYKYAFADALKELCASSFGVSEYDLYNLQFKEVNFSEFNKTSDNDYRFFEYRINTEQVQSFIDNLKALSEEIKLIITDIQIETIKVDMLERKIGSYRELMQYIGTEIVRNIVSDSFWIDILHSRIKNKNRVVITDARFPNERKYIRDRAGKLLLIERNTGVVDTHVSENQLHGDKYDGVIKNDKDLGYLEYEVERFYTCLTKNKKYKLKTQSLVSWLIERVIGFFITKKT